MNVIKSKCSLDNIKSSFIYKKIFHNLHEYKTLRIIKYNKKAQQRLNIYIDDYIEFSKIDIEIIHSGKKYKKFMNIPPQKKDTFFTYILMTMKKRKRNVHYFMMINLIKLE